MGGIKPYRLLFVLGCLAVLASLGASQESGTVIQVNCTQDFGCLHLLGQAIEAAPEGATIQLGSGVFFAFNSEADLCAISERVSVAAGIPETMSSL
ncbi:MAG: hypothetical protein A2Z21_02155 [Candidatus Fraserbacteria bacterium RBG_16_55_9]|uniref:HMA domain-containing protein n=1 Tax=Fraserbacteria sp. (strain RBG_16_55_9) TaxID=1817864 RepID=A0A1F5V1C2_FRAXR|nr:MAG: hypothetical protein A2Z21_02155 [Candidatus Fraserbacteria bacterium RBG_16_55_9]